MAQVDLSYLDDVATPQEVIQRITGDDEDVTDARRYKTMRVIMDALSDIKEVQGRPELTETERALFLAHRDASGVIRDKHDAKGSNGMSQRGRTHTEKRRDDTSKSAAHNNNINLLPC